MPGGVAIETQRERTAPPEAPKCANGRAGVGEQGVSLSLSRCQKEKKKHFLVLWGKAPAVQIHPPRSLLGSHFASPQGAGDPCGGTKATWLLAEQLLPGRGEVTWNIASSQRCPLACSITTPVLIPTAPVSPKGREAPAWGVAEAEAGAQESGAQGFQQRGWGWRWGTIFWASQRQVWRWRFSTGNTGGTCVLGHLAVGSTQQGAGLQWDGHRGGKGPPLPSRLPRCQHGGKQLICDSSWTLSSVCWQLKGSGMGCMRRN